MIEHNPEECIETIRPIEKYGKICLSIQASRHHYCEVIGDLNGFLARQGCMHVPLEYYKSVEIAIWPADMHHAWITKPSYSLEIEGFDDLWDGDDVAGYVPLERAIALQQAIKEKYDKT